MDVSKHIIYGAIFSIVVYFLFPFIGILEAIIIFLSSVLVDVDIYIYYVFKKKSLNLFKAYKWAINKKEKFIKMPYKDRKNFYFGQRLLHGIEIIIILFLAGIFASKWIFLIFVGFSFHLLLDLIDQVTYYERVDKFSLIHDLKKFKHLKRLEE